MDEEKSGDERENEFEDIETVSRSRWMRRKMGMKERMNC